MMFATTTALMRRAADVHHDAVITLERRINGWHDVETWTAAAHNGGTGSTRTASGASPREALLGLIAQAGR